ncbi:MAG: pyridoxine 5'-phosphate synthase [Candidatus Omnitrophica bacterium]|nr:pyridoxine 5'-phosphate synthase [Candidatus Omnitrophota bacterium]
MMRLGVNIDHIASLRQLRKGKEPNIVEAALICEQAGADSIVVHLREDRRHIQDTDVLLLRKAITTKLNLEMSSAEDIVRFCEKVKPDQATIVPEKRQEVTTEGGLDVLKNFYKIVRVIRRLEKRNIAVSLFIDPIKEQIDACLKLGVHRIELHTGHYANARTPHSLKKNLRQIKEAVYYAHNLGLHVYAGHGLDYNNVGAISSINVIEELNIGYSIVCRAAIIGLFNAVAQMKKIITEKSI